MAVTLPAITVQDNTKATRIGDAFDAEFPGRTESGMTKIDWVRYQLIQYMRQVTRNYEGNQAAGTARTTNDADVNSFNIT